MTLILVLRDYEIYNMRLKKLVYYFDMDFWLYINDNTSKII